MLGDSYVFGALMCAVASYYPHAFDGLTVSTFEAAPSLPLNVVGTTEPFAGHRVYDLSRDLELGRFDREALSQMHGSTAQAASLRAEIHRYVDGLPVPERRQASWRRLHDLVAPTIGVDIDDDVMVSLVVPDARDGLRRDDSSWQTGLGGGGASSYPGDRAGSQRDAWRP